jgi:hypothetical protein
MQFLIQFSPKFQDNNFYAEFSAETEICKIGSCLNSDVFSFEGEGDAVGDWLTVPPSVSETFTKRISRIGHLLKKFF